MNFAAKITDFSRRIADIDAKLAELAGKRREYAYGAADNNTASLKAIEALDQKADALNRERKTLLDATEQADRLLREQEAEAAKQDRERRERQARVSADAVLEVSAQIDAAMVALRALFERRSALLRELADTKIVAANYLLRLHQKFGPTCAARKAGLERYVSIEHVPVPNIATLSDSTRGLAGPLSAAVQTEEAA
jgi:ABC-type transporter Mla subunit MlaD